MSRKIVHGTSPNVDKPIAIFSHSDEDGIFDCYSMEDKYFTITSAEKAEYRKYPRSAPYMLISKNEKDPDLKHLTIKQQCKIIHPEGEKLVKLTGGKINLFRTGSLAKTSLQLFYDLCPASNNVEPIESYEIDILEAGRGPLIWAQPYKGKAYKYDICSEYPSIMASAQHKFPIGKGILKTLSKSEFKSMEYFSFGMYHVSVENHDYRVFKQNPDNWYTHTDLNWAKSQGYKIKLIVDENANALLYDRSALISGNVLFGPFVNFLFKLKKKGHSEVKKYLNCLWGALTQTNTMRIKTDKIFDRQEVLSILPTDDGELIFETAIKEKYYETDFARIKPFLLSYGRNKIAKIIAKNIDIVVRTHTDGIICKSEIKGIELGNKLGDLKFEGCGQCNIINSNKYTFT